MMVTHLACLMRRYHCHPAAADGCMQAGVLFTSALAADADSSEAAAAAGRVPSAVGAYMAAQQPPEALKWAGMGAAVLLPNGAASSDYTLAAGSPSAAAPASTTNMALSELLAKPVKGGQPLQGGSAAATGQGMVYALEWRAFCVGLGKGSLSMRLPAENPAAELAIARPHARRRRLRPPVSHSVLLSRAARNSGSNSSMAASQLSSATAASHSMLEANAAMRLGGGVLALLQGVLNTHPAAGERLQLNMRGPAGGAAGLAPGRAAAGMSTAGAAALLKVGTNPTQIQGMSSTL